jgi:hemerythrin superfamily protein
MKATELLKKDHGALKRLFTQFGKTSARAKKTRADLIDEIATELDVHAQIEEEIFYRAVEEIEAARRLVQEARAEHEDMKNLIVGIRGREPTDRELAGWIRELKDAVLAHATEEELEMFPLAERLGEERLSELGERLQERKQALSPERKARRGARRAA